MPELKDSTTSLANPLPRISIRTRSSTSAVDIKKEKSASKEVSSKEHAVEAKQSTETLDYDRILEVWMKFADEKGVEPRLQAIMQAGGFVWVREHPQDIKVICPTQFQADYFSGFTRKLADYMQKSIGLPFVIATMVDAAKAEDRPAYTDKERFGELAKDNPALLELKRRLNLDFE